MDENEAYERLIDKIESMDIPSQFDSSFRFPMPSYESSHSPSNYDLTHRRKNSRADEAVRTASID